VRCRGWRGDGHLTRRNGLGAYQYLSSMRLAQTLYRYLVCNPKLSTTPSHLFIVESWSSLLAPTQFFSLYILCATSQQSWPNHKHPTSPARSRAPTACPRPLRPHRQQQSKLSSDTLFPILQLIQTSSFIKEQLSLEAEAREALPYVSPS
jgi:hypothetical protein